MPHIIVEYAESLFTEEQLPALLKAVHEAVRESGLFDPSHIRTRAYAFSHYTHADHDQPYVHVQAHIKSGRSDSLKCALAQAVVDAVRSQSDPSTVITTEVVDMHKESYAKWAG